MAVQNPLFNVGFPSDRPTPAELDSLPTRVAILQGTQRGMAQAATAQAQDRLNTVEGHANAITDAALEPVNNALANIGQVHAAISAAGAQTALNAIQRPLVTGQALGYLSQGTPVLAPKNGGRKRNGRSGASQGSISPPIALSHALGTMALTDLSRGMTGTVTQPQPIQKPPVSSAALPTCGVVAFTTQLLGAPVVEFLSAGDLRVAAGAAAGGTWVAYPDMATARSNYPSPPWSINDYTTGINPCVVPAPSPSPPPGIFLPPGGVPEPTVPVVVKPPPPGVIVIPPAPVPPAPAPCPCPNIAITIPLPAQPPPNIAITVPPCPNCGAQGQPIVLPLPTPTPPIIVPAPPVNITVPPCPKCGADLPPITIQNNTGPVTVTIPPAGGGVQPTTPAPPPVLIPPGAPCPTCSIPYLALNHAQFVLAERAAQKTDFEILLDAGRLGLCCDADTSDLPDCSIESLISHLPDFVIAGRAVNLNDSEIATAAYLVGLCQGPEPQLDEPQTEPEGIPDSAKLSDVSLPDILEMLDSRQELAVGL